MNNHRVMKLVPHSRPWLTAEDERSQIHVLRSGMVAQGSLVKTFETKATRYLGVADAIAVPSGTAAQILALRLLDIHPGDEIVIPTYVCKSVMEAILHVGAKPVLADVDENGLLTVETVRPCLSLRTRAVIPVSIFGIDAQSEHLLEFEIPLLEDFCQAFGLERDDLPVPLHGSMAFYSFHATKCLTTGEGGLLAFSDPLVASRARALKAANAPPLRMSDLQAALGLCQLSRYNEMKKRRRILAQRYFDALPAELLAPMRNAASRSIFFRFTLRFAKDTDIDTLIRVGEQRYGVSFRRGVDELLHHRCGLPATDFPQAEECFRRTLSIPIYPALDAEDQVRVIAAVESLCG